MKTKQQAIQDAYGENYEKCNHDENGWTSGNWDLFVRLDGITKPRSNGTKWRPKTLQGIENNNGWIKIESDDDLPKDENSFWVVTDDEEIVEMEYFPKYKSFTELGVTHYQRIEKPKPPIF